MLTKEKEKGSGLRGYSKIEYWFEANLLEINLPSSIKRVISVSGQY
jgi:hypothetical protein